jgi:hypothetical protein
VDPFLKQAYEEGQRRAAEELDQKLKAAIKKREAMVGWKENSVAPNRLSSSNK